MGDDTKKRPDELRFVYEKTRHHRTVHANGAWSGLTPQLGIQVAFYNDLRPMPTSATHLVKDDDSLGPPVQQESTDLVREVDVTVVLSVATAKAIIPLLNQMVEQAEAIIAAKKPAQESDKEKV